MGKKRKEGGAAEKHEFSLADELAADPDTRSRASSRQRAAKVRRRQEAGEFVEEKMTSKILKEARSQQLEIAHERDEATGVAAARRAFDAVQSAGAVADSDEDEEDDDLASQGGLHFSDTESQWEEAGEVTEEDERALALFMTHGAAPQRSLGDIIAQRIREKEAEQGLGGGDGDDTRSEMGLRMPGMDPKVVHVYRGVGKLLSRYRSGKVPKALKIVPGLSNWEEVLYLTEPEKWSPNAMYQATRLFASNLNAKMAQRFFNLVLLPRVRSDIIEHKRLHFALYQALKKTVYKPAAFYKGILLPLCQSGTCTLREAFIVGSVLQKVSIPALHSSVAIMKIADMQYNGINSYFLQLLLNKKYALPYRVLDSLVAHFWRFMADDRHLPVIWQQALLCFVQRYKNDLTEEDKDKIKRLMKKHFHYQVSPEIQRELVNSRARGQKEAPAGHANGSRQPVSKEVLMEEDPKNLPDIGAMEEDY